MSSLDGIVLATIISKPADFNLDSTVSEVVKYSALSLLAMTLVYTATYFKQVTQHKAVQQLNTIIKRKYIAYNVFNQEAIQADKQISNLMNDYKLVETNYFNLFFDTIFYAMMGTVSSIYILWLSVPVGVLFILFAFLPMLTPKLFKKEIATKTDQWSQSSETFVQRITDLFNGLHVLKTYQARNHMNEKVTESLNTYETNYYKLNKVQSVAQWTSWIFSAISYIAPIFIGLLLVVQGRIDAAIIIAIFMASDRVVAPFRMVASNINVMQSTIDIRKNIQDTLNAVVDEDEQSAFTSEDVSVVLNDISFNYPNSSNLFSNIDLHIHSGDKVLLTGDSGSGKTTILNLIQGVINPTCGSIEYKDDDTSQLLADSTSFIARIQQDPFMFNESLEFNLTLGNKFSKESCLNVLDKVGLIRELGEDCLAKNYGNSGANLSGGQNSVWQLPERCCTKKPFC